MHVYTDHKVVAVPGDIDFPGLTKANGYAQQDGWHFVAHDLPNCALFAHAGHPLPHPMRSRYNWPSPWPEPFKHQVTTAAFFTLNPRGYCFNDIGTGKTASALWAVDFLWREKQLNGPVVICCTVSTMRLVWLAAIIELFGLRSRVEVLHGTKRKRLAALSKDADFYIINHDGLKIIGSELEARKDIELFIVDEGTAFRNRDTDAWHALDRQAGPLSGRGVWWLTGSPTPNSPLDAFGQAKLVAPWHLPRYYSTFRDDVTLTVDGMNGRSVVAKKGWQRYVAACLQPAVRFSRDECPDLPPCTSEYRDVEMSKEQRRVYIELRDQFATEHREGGISALTEPAKRTKLLQVGCGSIINDDKGITIVDFKPKMKGLLEIIREAGGSKVIVYAPYKAALRSIAQGLERQYKVATVSGDTPIGPRRDGIFQRFQHGDTDILVAHPACMAHGLTLTASHTIVWWAPLDDNEVHTQANGRITRPGQTVPQTIIYLRCNDLERTVYGRLSRKQSMEGALLEILEAR